MKVTRMPEPIPNVTSLPDIPAHLQYLLNIVGFLLASAAVWYGYFIKGKKESAVATPTAPPSTFNSFVVVDSDFAEKLLAEHRRIAVVSEKIYAIMKHESTEAEIRRRVRQELARDKRKAKGLTED